MRTRLKLPPRPVDNRSRFCNDKRRLGSNNSLRQKCHGANTPKLSPEMLIPRLGEYIVQKGLLSEDDLQRRSPINRSRSPKESPCLLGQALMDLGCSTGIRSTRSSPSRSFSCAPRCRRRTATSNSASRNAPSDFNEALNRLSELSQMKANFVSNISHELRTPLDPCQRVPGIADLRIAGEAYPMNSVMPCRSASAPRETGRYDRRPDHVLAGFPRRDEHETGDGGYPPPRFIGCQIRMSKAEERGVKLTVSAPITSLRAGGFREDRLGGEPTAR
jgi:hypothetical protein